jgi:hypothetical protein
MSAGLTITSQIHFSMRNRGRREMKPGPAPITETTPEGSVPRVSRLMALAIKMDGLIRSGAVPDQGDLAALGHVTRARVTQILNLTLLAPDIQEAILFLPRVRRGRDPLRETHLREVAALVDWSGQRRKWAQVLGKASFPTDHPRVRGKPVEALSCP